MRRRIVCLRAVHGATYVLERMGGGRPVSRHRCGSSGHSLHGPNAATTLDSRGWTLSRLTKLRGDRSQAAAVDGHVRVVGAEGRLADLKRPLQLRPGAGQVPKVLQHPAEIATVAGHARVVGAKGRLADLKRPLQLRPGAGQVPKVLQHPAEIATVAGHARVVGAKG